MKCPKCGYTPPIGRPKKLNDIKIAYEKSQGKSLADLAKKYGVTRGAIQAAVRRAIKPIRVRSTPT